MMPWVWLLPVGLFVLIFVAQVGILHGRFQERSRDRDPLNPSAEEVTILAEYEGDHGLAATAHDYGTELQSFCPAEDDDGLVVTRSMFVADSEAEPVADHLSARAGEREERREVNA